MQDEAQRQRIDDLLFAVTQQANGGVHGLLDSVYGFLQRRTDFYYEAEPNDKMGFPPGVAETMVYQYFRKYQEMHQKRFPPKQETKDRWDLYEKQQKEAKEKKAIEGGDKPEITGVSASPSQGSQGEKAKAPVVAKKPEVKKEEKKKEEAKPKMDSQAVMDMQKISTYNGDSTDNYDWSQTIQEITVQIPIPEGTNAKQMEIKIQSKRLFVKIKSQDKPLIDGELQEKVKVEDSFWSIEDKKFVQITFEKAYEAIWKTIIIGDKEIDPKTVDNSKKVEEFDLETQGHLKKVLYEQERKRNGLPTTEEEQQQKLMAEMMAKQGDQMPGGNPMEALTYDPKKYGTNKMGSGSGPAPPFKN